MFDANSYQQVSDVAFASLVDLTDRGSEDEEAARDEAALNACIVIVQVWTNALIQLTSDIADIAHVVRQQRRR